MDIKTKKEDPAPKRVHGSRKTQSFVPDDAADESEENGKGRPVAEPVSESSVIYILPLPAQHRDASRDGNQCWFS
jgi:hypothetical protein